MRNFLFFFLAILTHNTDLLVNFHLSFKFYRFFSIDEHLNTIDYLHHHVACDSTGSKGRAPQGE
jgi:hypothetical protein